jgi:arylsulfatase A
VDYSIEILQNRKDNVPFFIEICTREPHTPLTPPEKYMDLYDNERVRKLEQFIQYGRVLRPSYIDKNASELARYYYGTVTQLDQAFGRLMKALEELGIRDNTLVIFTSDNGPEHPVLADTRRDRSWGTPGEFRGMKRFLYEGGHRVAGIMRWPGYIHPGRQSDELISSVDLFPTICDLVDARLPGDRVIDGVSILSVLQGDPFLREKPLFWNIAYTHSPNMALRFGRYSLLGYFDPIESEDEIKQDWIKSATLTSFELYDLEEDPRQEKDLKYKDFELYILLRDRMTAILEDIQQDSPTWPEFRGKTRPINESMEIGIPGAVRK